MRNALLKLIGFTLLVFTIFAEVIIEVMRRASSFVITEPLIAVRILFFLVGLAMLYPQLLAPFKLLANTVNRGKDELRFLIYLNERSRRNRRALEELVREIRSV